jgi:prevent-host-death family protein
MPKTVSATEAKVRLGAMMDWAVKHGDEVIIETRGRPRAVLISFEEYQRIQQLQAMARRQAVLDRLEALAERVGVRNQDLTQEAAEELADRFSREMIEEMIEFRL